MTTKREMLERQHTYSALQSLGFTYDECERMRRISMALHSWFERECGTENGCIERDEMTGKTYWLNSHSGRRYAIRDMETGAKKRLAAIIERRNSGILFDSAWPRKVSSYIQSDPRGAPLYILRPGDVPEGQTADSCYTRGICVF